MAVPFTTAAAKMSMWSGRVAIYRLLRREVFEPEDLRLLATVYEDTAKTLGVTDQNGPVRELIARKLIELAEAGERDPDSLKELTVDAVRTSLQ
jgi:hypothetical protein